VKDYIIEAMKTWRKRNAAMILATQSSIDLTRNEMLQVVAESCGTLIFLANPRMDKRTYQDLFHLNETEANLVASLTPKKQLLIKRPDLSKVVQLNVAAKDYWIYTNSPADNEKKRRAFERYGFKRGLELLAKQGRAADDENDSPTESS
jgi:type IV secretion system protein VirB4